MVAGTARTNADSDVTATLHRAPGTQTAPRPIARSVSATPSAVAVTNSFDPTEPHDAIAVKGAEAHKNTATGAPAGSLSTVTCTMASRATWSDGSARTSAGVGSVSWKRVCTTAACPPW